MYLVHCSKIGIELRAGHFGPCLPHFALSMYTNINTIVIVCSYCKLPYIKEIVIVVYCIIYSCSNSDCYVFRYQFV